MYNQALQFARKAHHGQFRAGSGKPYITHPIRVSFAVETEFQKVLALLHDVIEDTSVIGKDIIDEFGFNVMAGVFALSHIDKNQSYDEYIDQVIAGGRDCIIVKMADIKDNLSDFPSEKMLDKGFNALEKLEKALCTN